MTTVRVFAMDDFSHITSCLISAIGEAQARLRNDVACYADDGSSEFTYRCMHVGGWIGWAELRSYDFVGTDSRDTFDRVRLVIDIVRRWCRDELALDMRRTHRKKSVRKPKAKPIPVGAP